MIANRSLHSSTMIPELPYDDVPAASEWICRAFGFKERLRIGDHRAQLVYGDGAVILTSRGATGHGAVLPTDHPYGEFSQSIADVDPASWGGTLR